MVLTALSGRGAADAVSRGQHAPHALKQGQGHQDVDDSEVAQVESLGDQAESNPGERGDRAERRNEIFGGKDDAKRLVMDVMKQVRAVMPKMKILALRN